MRELTRRGFLEGSLSVLVFRALAKLDAPPGAEPSGIVPFLDEPDVPMDTLYGEGLDGRLNTDLSKLSEQSSVIDSGRFFVRTRFPDRLAPPPDWRIRVSGSVKRPPEWSAESLDREAEDCGVHVMDCAGNTRARRFGLIGEARWRGVPLSRLLPQLEPSRKGARIRISGFDRRAPATASARDGSWIFDFEDLVSTKAFLATGLDGKPLSKDHGAPVRLIVPGWYGCASVKWVDGLVIVDREVEATAQMKEYASRTNQDGLPMLAKDYRPPRVEPAALPIRVERWNRSGRVF
ncbi:MAG TPA: molybdopterin-dependent oxidoreductase, partial [Thermoanaerobaculia bacterium]